MRKYRAVRFLRRFHNYDIGTVATFEESRAEAMVEGDVAEFVTLRKRKSKEEEPCPESAEQAF